MKSAQIVSLNDGLGVVDALADAARGGGWWQASGFVEEVELRIAGEGADPRRILRGRYTLISLSGPVGGPYAVLVAKAAGAGFELCAGELVSARSAGVRALWVPAQMSGAEPEFDEPIEPPRASAPAAAATPANSAWALQVAAAASAQLKQDEEDERAQPERGDLVHHFAFGWCEVIQVAGDRLKLRDTQGQGRIREIVIDVVEVNGPSEKDGKRAFKLTRRL